MMAWAALYLFFGLAFASAKHDQFKRSQLPWGAGHWVVAALLWPFFTLVLLFGRLLK